MLFGTKLMWMMWGTLGLGKRNDGVGLGRVKDELAPKPTEGYDDFSLVVTGEVPEEAEKITVSPKQPVTPYFLKPPMEWTSYK